MSRDSYASPFAERYSTPEMLRIFSPDMRYRTWRRLWIALAETQRELGLDITAEQIAELKKHAGDIDYEAVARHEKRLRHDVMAHIHAWGDQAPGARGKIHLGATSMYVVDNADLVILREALTLVRRELVNVIADLAAFAKKWADEPTVAYTHLQPAQFTTIGKRATLWLQDLLLDLEEVEQRLSGLRFLGTKGTTGTQANYLSLFDGDSAKVRELDARVAKRMGFDRTWAATGQTYTRKADAQVHATLSRIAESAHKFSLDLRLLQSFRQIQEPFGEEQVGSSTMAYKRNPMKCERITSLARLVIALAQNAAFTAASQWFERTLDDSAGKRIALPEAFLAVDAILVLYHEVAAKPDVRKDVVRAHVRRELPFIASEAILTAAAKAGGDRQDLHERIRKHSMAAAERVMRGEENDLIQRLENDGAFKAVKGKLDGLMDPARHVGRAPDQVREFLADEADTVLKERKSLLGWKAETRV
ncbi:MAG TPA: adenylosuccinate lyase [Planctomycetota bacterium]|nr:adenylosuccinate lyase [Planctomycetota bacterium]